MILRRIAEAIRRQDWFTVCVEVLIVVFGVFIGLQVDDWNEDRKGQAEERRFIAQLLTEVDTAIEDKSIWLDGANTRLELLRSGIDVIQSQRGNADLSDFQCQAIAFSHIIDFRVSFLPTLEELLSTDGLGILSNPQARRVLINYKSGLARAQAQYEFIRSDFANLIDIYGEAFPRNLVPADSKEKMFLSITPFPTTIDCQMDAIRADRNLRNRIVSNFARTQAIANSAATEISFLRQIKTELQETVR